MGRSQQIQTFINLTLIPEVNRKLIVAEDR